MYGAVYLTPLGFSSVAYIGEFGKDHIELADPVLGWQTVPTTDCFAVIHTETGYVLPGVVPTLSESLRSTWLQSGRLAANQEVIRGRWPKHHPPTMLEPAGGGEKFVSGYPHAWEYIRHWAFEVAPDWRSIALTAIFARNSIQRPIQEAERLYRAFGPTLRDAIMRGKPPTVAQMRRWRGLKKTRAEEYGDLESFQKILEWAPWCADFLTARDDLSREVRNAVAIEWLPLGLGIAKLTFTLVLSGRDGACLDTRMLSYFYSKDEPAIDEEESTDEENPEQYAENYDTNARSDWTPPRKLRQFLRRVGERSASKNARGLTRSAVRTYVWLEDRLADTPYFDPEWPQPYAKAQWMLWETLGRPAGTASHQALWDVILPLVEEATS